MTGNSVQAERRGSAIVLMINRIAAGNAIDLATANALGAAITTAEKSDARAIIITGAGDKFFCAGGDLKAYQAISTPDQLERTFGRVRQLLNQIERTSLCVIAAINGYALGGGLEFALACDLRIATRSARIGMPQSRLGLIPGWNGTERLVETVGRSKAMHLLLTAERLDADRAEAIGLIDRAVDGSAVDAAVEYAERLQQSATLALRASKEAVMSALRDDRATMENTTARLFERLWFSEDHREAERAFMEKRSPFFRGR